MKFIIISGILMTFAAFSYAQESLEALGKIVKEAHDVCIKDIGVDVALVTSALRYAKFIDDPKLKCFFKCFMQKIGRMDAKGKLDFSSALDHLLPNADKAKVTVILEKCRSSKGADDCETAYLGAKCFRENVGPIYHRPQ